MFSRKMFGRIMVSAIALHATAALGQEDAKADVELEFSESKTSEVLTLRTDEIFGEDVPVLIWDDAEVDEETGLPLGIENWRFPEVQNGMASYPDAEANCDDRSISRAVRVYPLHQRTQGDNEMGGNDTHINITAGIQYTPGRIFIMGIARMTERHANYSAFQRSFHAQIFDVASEAPGCRIKGISGIEQPSNVSWGSGYDEHRFLVYRHEDSWDRNRVGDAISFAYCRVDTIGQDDGKIGCPVIQVRSFTVHLESINIGNACKDTRLPFPVGPIVNGQQQGVVSIYPLRRYEGDAKLGNVNVARLYSVAWANDQYAYLFQNVRVRETKGDGTFYYGSYPLRLFDRSKDAPGCTKPIERIEFVETGSGFIVEEVQGSGWKALGAGPTAGLFSSADCRTNTPGRDDGEIGCRSLNYSWRFAQNNGWALRVVFEKDNNEKN